MNRKILTIVTSVINDRIVVGERELADSILKHFASLTESIVLEIVQMTLKNPTTIFLEIERELKHLHYYYRMQHERYFVVVVKKVQTGNFFASVYETGKKPRNKHQRFERIW